MKRYGFLIEKVVQESNLEDAFRVVLRGKKNTKSVLFYKENRNFVLSQIKEELLQDIYKPRGYNEFEVNEYGKTRIIQSLCFKDRIALHAIINILRITFVDKMMIRDTYAGIKKRGIHDGLCRIKRALRDREGTRYCLKLDLQKFYHSINQDILIKLLKNKIKDKIILNTLIRIIRSYDKGLAIGYHSSQLLGNFYLNGLDHFIKDTLKIKHYFRYCDDIVILSSNKEELHTIFSEVKNYIEVKLDLKIKKNYQIFPIDVRGIDFLGYVIRHDYVLVRKRIKIKAKRKLTKIKSKSKRFKILSSFWGWIVHCNGRNLFYKLTGMKDFKELKVSYKPKDGKKRFGGNLTPLGNLLNCNITVLDFETEIKTKQGNDRYVIQYELDGQKGTFITNSEEMKNILDQIRDLDELPFKTTIKRESFGSGNKFKYVFS